MIAEIIKRSKDTSHLSQGIVSLNEAFNMAALICGRCCFLDVHAWLKFHQWHQTLNRCERHYTSAIHIRGHYPFNDLAHTKDLAISTIAFRGRFLDNSRVYLLWQVVSKQPAAGWQKESAVSLPKSRHSKQAGQMMVAGILYFVRHPAILCILCVLQKRDVRAEKIKQFSFDRFSVSPQPLFQQPDEGFWS